MVPLNIPTKIKYYNILTWTELNFISRSPLHNRHRNLIQSNVKRSMNQTICTLISVYQLLDEQRAVHHIGALIYLENKLEPAPCFIKIYPKMFHSLSLGLFAPHPCHQVQTSRREESYPPSDWRLSIWHKPKMGGFKGRNNAFYAAQDEKGVQHLIVSHSNIE